MTRPDRIVAAWTAMEKIDEENGCLFVVPGTHRESYSDFFFFLPPSLPPAGLAALRLILSLLLTGYNWMSSSFSFSSAFCFGHS